MENRIGPSPNRSTLLLTRSDVAGLLDMPECIAAIEDAFRRHAIGEAGAPGVLGMHVGDGSFHIKAAALTLERPYFAAKLNANFPQNGPRLGLPTIQGCSPSAMRPTVRLWPSWTPWGSPRCARPPRRRWRRNTWRGRSATVH